MIKSRDELFHEAIYNFDELKNLYVVKSLMTIKPLLKKLLWIGKIKMMQRLKVL